ncbi:GDSL esterase/lipase at1g09390 [Phtheirospermum japonicum]|uniref:GDSL esterase/lipase at1g09390 n=1 Tax=Phtheirospermum japonicum TaxID=374723 RepID=A0A830C3F6_9LAMI|nr:GDSL esterase/lipase at1g09390 [Phtheirospermum japonicum]
MGFNFDYPDGRAFFHKPTGRLCDGRLVIDFLCENLKTSYLTPYMDSLEPNFTNGVNFAIAGSSTLPKYVPFSLGVQILQFMRFHNRSLEYQSKGTYIHVAYNEGFKNLVREEDFKNALYTIDIGQNDLRGAFNSLSYPEIIERIPFFISEIRDAMWGIYLLGGKNFWVHNTGPFGCLPENLGSRITNANDFDQFGCIKYMNEGAKAFNAELSALCQGLRFQMKNSTIVYVDIYSIKYNLFANSASYGFKNPLMACCGHGGPPYNYDPSLKCRDNVGYTVCEQGSRYISWDGLHYTEVANAIVAGEILTTNYSTPPLGLNFFCNN